MKGLQAKIDELSVVTLAATAAAESAAKSATAMQNAASSSTSSALVPAATAAGCNAGMNVGTVLNLKCASVHGMAYQLFQFVSTIAFTVWFALSFMTCIHESNWLLLAFTVFFTSQHDVQYICFS